VAQESFAAGLVGITLDGRYRLDALLGEGGMGAVYRAYHLAMDRKVAVKLLKPHLTNDETALRRFAREANATLKVESPHAVRVLDYGVTPLKDYYMVLEYLDGRTASRELDIDGIFAPSRVIHIACQVLEALGAAHRLGLIHRDIKPDNILLMRVGDDPDFAKVLDFGVAKLMQGSAIASKSALSLTQAGMVFGTPEFMSPEQACGLPLDGRSDLYSLAATMFALLTGKGLFEGKTAIEWLTHHARTPPPHLGDVIPELAEYRELDAVLQRCLAKHKEPRPHDAAEMAKLLQMVAPLVSGAKVSGRAEIAATLFSPSKYIEALPLDAMGPETVRDSAKALTTTGVERRTRRRGLVFALGAIVVVGVVATAIVLATTKSPSAAPVDTHASVPTPDAHVTHADAATPDATVVAVADAPGATPPRDAAPIAPVHPTKNPELEEQLRLAEAAKQSGDFLNQIKYADLALKADPRNVRARFLLGDGLIASQDFDHGCKYLRALTRYPPAQARAKDAGCPGN
jgi:hypothetical protein